MSTQESPIETGADLRIEYAVSREEYIAALRDTMQLLLRSVRWGTAMVLLAAASVACGIAIGMGYIELVNGYIGRHWRLQWLIAVAFLSVCLLTIWQQRLRAARIYSAYAEDDGMVLGSQALVITRDALTHEGRGMTTRVAWPAIRHIAVSDARILIVLKNYFFMVVPEQAFSEAGQRTAWLAALREHVSDAVMHATPARSSGHSGTAPPDVAQAAQPASPAAFGLRENMRAGARLAFFRRVRREEFVSSAEAFITLMVLELGLLLAFGIASVGLNGQFNYYELPRSLLIVPLLLLFGVAAARLADDRSLLLALPVALLAGGLIVSLAGGALGILAQQKIIVVAAKYWRWVFYVQLVWWSAIVIFAVWRFAPLRLQTRTANAAALAVLGIVLLAAPSIWYPQGYLWRPVNDAEAHRAARENHNALANERGFYAQHGALQRALSALLPERPGVTDLYTVTAGLDANEDVFMKEVKLIDTLFRQRFDANGRSLVLINNPKTVHETPIASATSLSIALRHIGGLMNRDEDVLVLYVSSHGSEKHHLSVNFWPLRLQTIDPPVLKKALDDAAIKWKVVVVSACYSGGFVEPLKDDNTLIITASSATRTSFGCGNESDATYLAKALFDEELRMTYSFETAFEQARKTIRQKELAQGHEPSEPRIFVGAAIREKLLQVEKRLSGLKR